MLKSHVKALALLLALVGIAAALLIPVPAATAATGEARVLFFGDMMMGRYVNQRLRAYGWDSPFTDIRGYVSGADIAVGNLESPLVQTDRIALPEPAVEQYNLSADARAAAGLARAGFDLLSVANNHSFDAGLAGLQQTVQAVRGAGMVPFGLDDATTQQAIVREANGVRIAFLAYTAVPTNVGYARAAGMPFVQYLNPYSNSSRSRLLRDVAAARRNADVVALVLHWGTEYQTVPDAAQKKVAALAAEAGADLVAGAHPHVVQGLNVRRSGGRATVIAYSLGNALFDQSIMAERRQGFALETVFDASGVKSARLVPIETRKRNNAYVMFLADDASGQPTLRRAVPSTDAGLVRNSGGVVDITYRR